MHRSRVGLVAALAATILTAGCFGPSVRKLVRIAPSESGGNRQEKSGVIMEVTPIDEVSVSEKRFPEVIGSAKRDPTNPYSSEVEYYVLGRNVQFRVSVTNRTGHVLRFTGAVIKVLDEANNMYDAYSKADLSALHVGSPFAADAAQRLRPMRILDGNTEVLPDMTWTGYISFNLRPEDAGDLVKFAVYDLTTKTDEAGKSLEKSRFEFNFKKEVVEK